MNEYMLIAYRNWLIDERDKVFHSFLYNWFRIGKTRFEKLDIEIDKIDVILNQSSQKAWEELRKHTEEILKESQDSIDKYMQTGKE